MMSTPQDIKNAFLVSCEVEGREIDDQPQRMKFNLAVIPNTTEHQKYLSEVYEFCETMQKNSLLGADDPNYFLVPGFEKWTLVEDLDYEIPAVYTEMTACHEHRSWPLDPVMAHLDPTIPMLLRGYTMHYFDHEGKPHSVKPVITFQIGA